jgi:peptidoglycan/LPS O-acetylase OafA/YrhL
MTANLEADGAGRLPDTSGPELPPVPVAVSAKGSCAAGGPETSPAPQILGRDRYLDLLRAVALIRIVAFHTFAGAAWMTLAFPSLGVMFALAGSLMARSLDRPAAGVLKSRARRLLLPLWIYSLTVVGALLWQGWRPGPGDTGGWWAGIVLWFVPIGDASFPESIGSEGGLTEASWGMEPAGVLWYIRAYFWFVLLSPLLLRLFRRLAWATLLAPLGLVFLLSLEILVIPGPADSPITDFATYGSCWILGFAHRDGLLRRIPFRLVLLSALVLMILGLLWAWSHLEEIGWDLGANPLAQALWSLGACALLLRISPSWTAIPRGLKFFGRAIALINNRAITVYLWHNVLLIASVPLIDLLWNVPVLEQRLPWLLDSEWLQFTLVWLMLGVLIPAVGWVEDLAAKRPPHLWPAGGANNDGGAIGLICSGRLGQRKPGEIMQE